MKDINDNVTANLPYDQSYIDWLQKMRQRVAEIKVPLYETDADRGVLWNTYLAYLAPEIRQEHTCFCCQHFFKLYAHLVYFEDGVMKSVFWKAAECAAENKSAVEALELAVQSKRATNRFWIDGVCAGEYVKGGFDHIAAKLPDTATVTSGMTAYARIGKNKEDLKNMRVSLNTLNRKTVQTALTLLKSGKLARSEVAISQAEFLLSLYSMDKMQFLLAVSEAPDGFLHPRSSMISTLLEDIEKGKNTEQISASWALKMDPLAYQRPQAAPSGGQIERAEKLFAEMGLATALQRRWAGPEDLDPHAFWMPPAAKEQATKGLFGHLKTKQSGELLVSQQPVEITFTKFLKSVLPTAEAVQLISGSVYGCSAASDLNSKPLLQWDDGGANRKTYSLWAQTAYTLELADFGVKSGVEIRGAVYGGWMDGPESKSHHGQRGWWYADAEKYPLFYSALFPEFLRSELREVRSVIEAYNKQARKSNGMPSSLVVCVGIVGSIVHVKSGDTVLAYRIDRWD